MTPFIDQNISWGFLEEDFVFVSLYLKQLSQMHIGYSKRTRRIIADAKGARIY
jgi:hypothetical protein